MDSTPPEANEHREREADPAAGDDVSQATVSEEDATDDLQPVMAQLAALHQRGMSGGGWFYWVAALSLVNSVIFLSGGDTHFVIGLGVTLMADGIAAALADQAPEMATTFKGIAFVFDLIVAGVLCLIGWLSRKAILAVFAIGMVLYALDGLIFLLFEDWMSIGFHVFALVCMWGGFSAFRQLNALKRDLEAQLGAASPTAVSGP